MGRRLYRTLEEATVFKKPIHITDAWASIYGGPEYRELSEQLDQAHPPKDVTITLGRGELWTYEMPVKFFFYKQELADVVSPLWMRLSLELWPFNAEYFKANLAEKLQRRWRKDGYLWVGTKAGRYSLSRMTTEPILLELNLSEM